MEPSAWDLGFLAMCHFRLGDSQKAEEFRESFLKAAVNGVPGRDTQGLIQEIQLIFEPTAQ